MLAQDLHETDILTPQPLWAEQWPDVWLDAAKTSIWNTVAKSSVDAKDIRAIAISGLYGGSGIPLDAEMKPVRLRLHQNSVDEAQRTGPVGGDPAIPAA